MTKYEMLYILDASLEDEAKEALIKKFEDLVVNNGGVIHFAASAVCVIHYIKRFNAI